MGHIIDRACIVSGNEQVEELEGDEVRFHRDRLEATHAIAVELFGDMVTPIVKSSYNGVASFFISSSGSKTGWEGARVHDERLAEFVQRARRLGGYQEFVFVTFGEVEKPSASWEPTP